MYRNSLTAAGLLAGCALAALSTTAAAQTGSATPNQVATSSTDSDPDAEQQPEMPSEGDVVVTAQKRSERLQDVPVAVSVIGAAALEATGRPSIESAVTLVPALNFQKSGTTLNQSLFLRGVGTTTFSIAGEPSVSAVVDGVVYARSGEAFGDLVDRF